MALGLGLAAGAAAAGELLWPEADVERRMLLAEEARTFRAVGRLNIAGARFCTATLVSDREVLTAAHCLYHPRTRAPVPLSELRFVPGHRLDDNAGVRGVAAAAQPPGFVMLEAPTPDDLRSDIALLALDAPVDPLDAPAFATGPLLADDAPTTIVSYARDRAQAPSISEGCPAVGVIAELLVVGCEVERGVSGAPVFAGSGAEARLVAVVSAMGTLPGGGEFALSVLAAPWIDGLRADLAAAAGPAPVGEGDTPEGATDGGAAVPPPLERPETLPQIPDVRGR